MLGSLFHLPAGLIICFAQIRPFLCFLETSLTIPIILSSEADISSSWVKFCARHQQKVCCSPSWRAGFQFCDAGCSFFSFYLKVNLKHFSVQWIHDVIPQSIWNRQLLFQIWLDVLRGRDTKSVANRLAMEVVWCLGAAASEHPKATWMLEQRLIYAQWPKEGEAWWVTTFLCLQRDLCTHSASSPPFPTEQPAPIQAESSGKGYAGRDHTSPSSSRRTRNVQVLHCCVSVGDRGHSCRELLRANHAGLSLQYSSDALTQKGCLANIVRKHQKLYSLLKTQGGVGKALKLSNFFFSNLSEFTSFKVGGELVWRASIYPLLSSMKKEVGWQAEQ